MKVKISRVCHSNKN